LTLIKELRIANIALISGIASDINCIGPALEKSLGAACPPGRMVLDFVNRKLPGIVSATISIVDARDVATCHIAAAERGRAGVNATLLPGVTRQWRICPRFSRR